MTQGKIYRYLDLSGYAFTGKHAVIDLVREFNGYYVPDFEFEFNLLRVQGGIRDLETALVEDWSLVRSDAAIRRFRRIIKRFGNKNSLLRPSTWFSACGWNYNDFFNGKFFPLSDEYMADLVELSWKTNWPYPFADISGVELFTRKLLKIFGFRSAMDFNVCLTAPQNFLDITRNYLNNLMEAFVNGVERVNTVVMHNSMEPFNPYRALKYFYHAKSIIVDRDPRDNYVAGLWYRPTALPPSQFIQKYQHYRRVANRYMQDESNILRMNFEDLVLNYEITVKLIYEYLEENPSIHIERKRYFDPDVSRKNVGIWRNYDKQDEIEMIYHELREFCYD